MFALYIAPATHNKEKLQEITMNPITYVIDTLLRLQQ